MIFAMLIANILGIILFLYLFWKRLKEDYLAEKIFNAGFILLFGITTSIVISNYLFLNYWFWITLFVSISLELFICYRFKFKFFESLDALVVSFLPWLSLFYLNNAINNSNLKSFLAFWIILILIFIYFLLDNFYRGFSWYKSGRVGFSGLVVLIIFFTIRFISTFFWPDIVGFSGVLDAYFSGTFFVISLLLLLKIAKV